MTTEMERVFSPKQLAAPTADTKYAFRPATDGKSAATGATDMGFARFLPSKSAAAAPPTAASTDTAKPAIPSASEAHDIVRSAAGSLIHSKHVTEIAKMSLLGMLAGAVYAAAKGTAETQGVLHELKYKTSAFDLDPFASQLFFKVGRYEHLQPEAYRLAVHFCDKLFLLERHLIAPHTRPTDTDIPMAQACHDAVIAQLMLMRNKAENGTQRGELNILKHEINEMLKDHMRRIRGICSTLRC